MSNGKGSKRRPMQISQEEFEKRWDEVFKPKKTPGTRYGRTTRMLQYAIEQSKTKTVAVIMANHREVERAKQIVGPNQNIKFFARDEPDVDWDNKRIRGSDIAFYADHYCWNKRF